MIHLYEMFTGIDKLEINKFFDLEEKNMTGCQFKNKKINLKLEFIKIGDDIVNSTSLNKFKIN